jgi:hypothetical protein
VTGRRLSACAMARLCHLHIRCRWSPTWNSRPAQWIFIEYYIVEFY